ncbi:MAG: hypothetical protein OXD42_06035, partial [Rhodospirillaceae bacterium]|nr:hypothetical protein [Rhodospirillaceae bacterium]
MMRSGGGQDAVRSAQLAMDGFEALQKAEQGTRTDRDMTTCFHIVRAQFAGGYPYLLSRFRSFCPEQVFREQFAEAAVNLHNVIHRSATAFQAPVLNPLLDGDMRPGLKLEISPGCVG